MSEKRVFLLAHDEARRSASSWIMSAPDGWVVCVEPPKRSLEQGAKFHAICSDISRARIEWAGKPRSADEWKMLLVSGHAMLTKHGAELVIGLEGEYVSIRESTALMSVARSSSLIEYAQAFAAMQDIFTS